MVKIEVQYTEGIAQGTLVFIGAPFWQEKFLAKGELYTKPDIHITLNSVCITTYCLEENQFKVDKYMTEQAKKFLGVKYNF